MKAYRSLSGKKLIAEVVSEEVNSREVPFGGPIVAITGIYLRSPPEGVTSHLQATSPEVLEERARGFCRAMSCHPSSNLDTAVLQDFL